MKKLLLLLLFAPILGFSQDKAFIQGAWGITFGSSVAAAKQVATTKGAQAIDASSNTQTLLFTKVMFAQRKVDTVQLYFYRDKFWQAIVKYPDEKDIALLPKYQALIKELSEVYGQAKIVDRYKQGYGPSDELNSIQLGFADIGVAWRIPDTPDGNTVELHITEDFRFILTYTDSGLKKLVDEQNMKLKSRDY